MLIQRFNPAIRYGRPTFNFFAHLVAGGGAGGIEESIKRPADLLAYSITRRRNFVMHHVTHEPEINRLYRSLACYGLENLLQVKRNLSRSFPRGVSSFYVNIQMQLQR